MRGIYLAAYKDFLPGYDLDYNDICNSSSHINIIADMLSVDLSSYDFKRVLCSNGNYSTKRISKNCQGGNNVNVVFSYFLEVIFHDV